MQYRGVIVWHISEHPTVIANFIPQVLNLSDDHPPHVVYHASIDWLPIDDAIMTPELFLGTIREHPQDDGPRLVYADWLEENGDCDGRSLYGSSAN